MQSILKRPQNYLIVLTHVSLWVAFLGIPVLLSPVNNGPLQLSNFPSVEDRRVGGILLNFCLISFFYCNYAWFLPRFYLKGRTSRYFLAVFIAYIFFQFLVIFIRNYLFSEMLANINMDAFVRFSHVVSSVFFMLMLAASSGLRLGEEWRRTENSRREMDRRRLEAELTLMKSQINPHFLLNSLNNLYALALTKPEKTPESLLMLSEMVAYILYECAKPEISIEKDLQFIQNYVELQRLRMPPNAVLSVDISDNYPKNAVIEPMILITFIENAFKHGLTTKQPCEIFISIKFQDNNLLLKVENPVLPPKGTPNDDVPGIGLSNTQTRLQYAYPEKHVLKINNDGKKHVVELNLELKVLEQVHLLKSNVPNPENYLNPDIR